MNCVACGHANRDTARFCEECGAALQRICSKCDAELRPAARFCDSCGQPTESSSAGGAGGPGSAGRAGSPIAPPAPKGSGRSSAVGASGEARKIVSIIFADLAGSTSLHERLDPESVRRFMESYYREMRAAVASHEGTVVKLLGDGVMAAFGVPLVAENDALRAVRAGVEMQRLFGELARREAAALGDLGLRVGINTGEVVVSGDRTDVVGDPVNIAARLQQDARPGDVVIGESTQRLVGGWVTLMPLGRIAIKGRAGGVKAFRLVSLDPPAGSATTVFVGREEELSRISAAFDAVVAGKAVRAAVLLGSPGLGKSRLIEEFAHRLGDTATVLRAHCDAGGGATFAPLTRALRELFQLESGLAGPGVEASIAEMLPSSESETARIVRGIAGFLSGSATTPEETFFLLRRLFGMMSESLPVVLVLDDVHWAEPMLLEFIEHLIQWGSGLRIFILLGARPEFREIRSSLVMPGGPVNEVVTLSGLDAGAAMKLAASVIGASDLPAALAARVLATSEGNPLFVGELVRMLVDEGVIVREGNRWVAGAGLDTLEMPPTIHALLAARIERLRPEEIAVLERASVMGRQFSRGAVAELLPREVRDLDARLETLRRAELIERDTGWFLGEPVLRFHHVLIRDAAYRRLLKGTRAELHARLAQWIESKADDLQEHEETLGWHLEQAHQHLSELGPLGEEGRELGRRAARHLSAAGRRALVRDDIALAANLLGRAIDRLEPGDPARDDLALDVCEALLAAGEVRQAAAAIDQLAGAAGDSPRLQAWHTCFAGQLKVMTDPEALQDTADGVAAAATVLAAQADAAGEAKAHFVHAQALARLGRVGACEAALDLALAAARRAGDRRRANAVLAGAPLAALWGPSPVTRASGRCLDVVRVLRITQGAPAVEAVALSCQGVLEALRGRTDAARRMIASAHKMVEELGITHRLLETDVFGGRIDLLEGNATAAEQAFRASFEGLRELGHGIDAARAAALLGRALLAQGRAGEAEEASQESEKLAGDDLQASIAWRVVRARALAQRGDHGAAIEVAKKAVEIATATDALLDHADARLALAVALRAAGRTSEGDQEERRAFDLWGEKGATELVERTQAEAIPAYGTVTPPAPVSEPARPRSRRVRPNFATEEGRRADAAVAARDARAALDIYRRDVVIVDHPHGASYGYEEVVERVRVMIEESAESDMRDVPLATLGPSLALCRLLMKADGSDLYGSSVGATDVRYLILIQADENARAVRLELFAEDKLSAAIARLYERYAELMPEGPEREQAARVARSYDGIVGRIDLRIMRESIDPSYVCVDHRRLGTWSAQGADELIEHFSLQEDLAAGFTARDEDVLALEAHAFLVRRTYYGHGRESGGSFENRVLLLTCLGGDGLMTRGEVWEPEQEAEALARFDELVSAKKPTGRDGKGIRRNAALRQAERHHAAIVAHDSDALRAQCSPDMKVFYHPTGTPYGTEGLVETWKSAFGAKNLRCEQTTLATLGESLVLVRQLICHDGLQRGDMAGVGPIEVDTFLEMQVDEHEKCVWAEVFAGDRLSDAIARLYERYAETLPEGREKPTAARVAHSFRSFPGRFDPDALAEALAPDFTAVDHRTLSTWTSSGPEALLGHFGLQFELATVFSSRDEDILALGPRALLTRRTYFGVAKDSGGNFENWVLVLWVFNEDGLIVRSEVWDAEEEAAARARFEELLSGKALSPRRRIRRNAALQYLERRNDAFLRRDLKALRAGLSENVRIVSHPTETAYGVEGLVDTWKGLFKAANLRIQPTPIAVLGDSLAMERQRITTEGVEVRGFASTGPTEFDCILDVQVDEAGLCCWSEVFEAVRLGGAIARLYERHAELMPPGPQRERATAIARSVAAALGPYDLDRYETVHAPDIQYVDHRMPGVGRLGGAAAVRRWFGSLLEAADRVTNQVDDILALRPDGLLLRWTNSGVERAGGGRFDRTFLWLGAMGADGLLHNIEIFDTTDESSALARFDELVGRDAVSASPGRTDFENAASLADAWLMRCFNARDWDGVLACIAPEVTFDERRRLVRNTADRKVWLEQFRLMYDLPESRFTIRLLATRGNRLSLHRHEFNALVAEGAGPLEMEPHMTLHEVDEQGRIVAIVLFDLEEVEAAHAELERRYEAHEGAEHRRIGSLAGSFVRAVARRDWDAVAALCAPEFIEYDHRSLAVLGTTRGAEAWVRNFRTLVDLAPDTVYRSEHFRAGPGGFISLGTWYGSREGGNYEIALVPVIEADEQGRITRADLFDPGQLDQAWARFREISAAARTAPMSGTGGSPFANAATRLNERLVRAWDARDWDAVASLHGPKVHMDDRRKLKRLDAPEGPSMEQLRFLFDLPDSGVSMKTLATRGERLSLTHLAFEGKAAEDGGPFLIEYLGLDELDEEGRFGDVVIFDPGDIEAAYAELDARWQAGDAAIHPLASKWAREFARCLNERDWEAMPRLYTTDQVAQNHRLVGWGKIVGGDGWRPVLQALVELSPDVRLRLDHVRTRDRGVLMQYAWVGTRDGGAFETPILMLAELNDEGRQIRLDVWDPDRIGDAWAKFEAIRGSGHAFLFANAATRLNDRILAEWEKRNWPGILALHSAEEDGIYDDRRRLMALKVQGREGMEQLRFLFDQPEARMRIHVLATRGERLSLDHILYSSRTAAGGGSLEIEYLAIGELNESGLVRAVTLFDVNDTDSAYASLDAQWQAGEGRACPLASAWLAEFCRAFAERDWPAMTRLYSPDQVAENHRLVGWGTLSGPGGWNAALQELVALAPDVRLRIDHLRNCDCGFIMQYAWVGTRDGGPFESPMVMVVELDEKGRQRRLDVWDIERLDEAGNRFARLQVSGFATPKPPRPPADAFSNAAQRAIERFNAAWLEGDWGNLAKPLAMGFRYFDRRRMAQIDLDREQFVEFTRELSDTRSVRSKFTPLATRGERLALHRWSGEVAGGDIGPSRIEHLNVIESNERGELIEQVRFDADELDAAYAELDARFEAGEAAAHPLALSVWHALRRAGAEWHLDHVIALCAPNFVRYDHRPLALLGTTRGAAAWMGDVKAMLDLAPDTKYRIGHVRLSSHALLIEGDWFGTRDGGEYEMPLLPVIELNDEGRIVRTDLYEPVQWEQAWARFREIGAAAPAAPIPAASDSAFANSAVRAIRRFSASWRARDWDSLANPLAGNFRYVDRRRMAQLDLDRGQYVTFTRELSQGRSASMELKVLATRGERLALYWWSGEVAGGDIGPSRIEHLNVIESNEQGDLTDQIRFDADELEAALSELDARFEAGNRGVDLESVRWLRRYGALVRARDWKALAGLYAPDLESRDHRITGWGTLRGPAAQLEALQTMVELAPDARLYSEHQRVSGRAILTEGRWVGTRDGGAFESPYLSVLDLGTDGRVRRMDFYELSHLDRALARFAELGGRALPPAPFESTAARVAREVNVLYEQQDMRGFAGRLAESFRFHDRRSMALLELDRDQYLEFTTQMSRGRSIRTRLEVLGTRGEWLVLFRLTITVEGGGGGPSELEHLNVIEVNERGEVAAHVRFDPGERDAAFEELSTRYEATLRGAALQPALWMRRHEALLRARDWKALAGLYAPEFVSPDHRLAGWGTLHGPAGMIKALQAMVDLAPDARMYSSHQRVSGRAALLENVWRGTRDGGAFESPFLAVVELGSNGKARRIEFFELHHLDRALARFADLEERASAPSPFENAATRVVREGVRRAANQDIEGYARTLAEVYRYSDRRRIARIDLNRDEYLRFTRELSGGRSMEARLDILATAGERFALFRLAVQVEGDEVGPSEVEHLNVVETDDQGLIVRQVRFDADDLDAAYAELDARWLAGEATGYPRTKSALLAQRQALVDRNWAAFTALFRPDTVCHDHRFLGWGTYHGPEAFVETQRALIDLAPDTRWRTDHARMTDRGWFVSALIFGTRDGGPFEIPFVRVTELDDAGLIIRIDLFDLHQRDQALARFAELQAPGALRFTIPPLAGPRPSRVVETMDRWFTALEEGINADRWEAVRALTAPGVRFEDRQRLSLVSGDRDLMIESLRARGAIGARVDARLIGLGGDRVAGLRMLWSGGPPGGRFEVEYLSVIEIDEAGLMTASILFDADAADAAREEMLARWGAIDPAARELTRALGTLISAFNDRDPVRLRAAMMDDIHVEDYRRAGMGRIDGADACLSTLTALWGLTADARAESGWFWPTHAADVALTATRLTGTLADGGAFESEYLFLFAIADGRIARLEMFEMDARDAALARFEELSSTRQPDRLAAGASPNEATAWLDRFQSVFNARDWDAMRALYAPQATYEDRQGLSRLSGGLDLLMASLRERAAAGARLERIQLLGTAGSRIAVQRLLWAGGEVASRFEMEFLVLQEVEDTGRLKVSINFDGDDERAAQREMWDRWAAIDPAAEELTHELAALLDAFNNRDPVRLRAAMADDIRVEDHRRTGMGRIDGAEDYAAAVAALWGLASDTRGEAGWFWLAHAPGRALTVFRLTGTLADGGPFESEFLYLYALAHGRIARLELFEINALDAALARFEELRPDPLRIPPNAASRAMENMRRLSAKHGLDSIRSLLAGGFSFDDRKKRSLVRGGVEEFLLGLEYFRDEMNAQLEARLLATAGDRLALSQLVWRAAPSDSSFEILTLQLVEIDAEGRIAAMVLFDAEDRAAAHNEMFERFVVQGAGGLPAGLMNFVRALNGRDLAGVRKGVRDDVVVHDHRRMIGDLLEGAEAYLASVAALQQLTTDSQFSLLYLAAIAAHGCVAPGRVAGRTVEGAEFEQLMTVVLTHQEDRLSRIEIFEPEQLPEALARFEELRPDPLRIPLNEALRALGKLRTGTKQIGNEELRTRLASGFIFEDRSRRAMLKGGAEEWLRARAFLTQETAARYNVRVLATAGDRLVLLRRRLFETPGEPEFEIEHLALFEVDEAGQFLRHVLFDVEDEAAAHDELFERYVAQGAEGLPAAAIDLARGLNQHDLQRVRRSLADHFVLEDHRRTGLGRIEGAEPYVASVAAMNELSPNVTVGSLYTLALAPHGRVQMTRTAGSNVEGGTFESYFLLLMIFAGGRVQRMEFFEPEQIDRALARLGELRPDPLQVPSNSARRAMAKIGRPKSREDLDRLRELVTDDFLYDDRQKRSLVRGGVGEWLRALEYLFNETDARIEARLIATSGDRLALDEVTVRESRGGAPFEIRGHRVVETDEVGLIRALILFDLEDEAAAREELYERYVARGADGAPPGMIEFWRGMNARDAGRVRTALSDDFVLVDRRRTGLGHFESPETYVDSLRALFALTPDVRSWLLYNAAVERHGRVVVTCRRGTYGEGCDFEQVSVVVSLFRGDRIARLEFFEPEHLDAALARLEELRPDPLGIPPNAAAKAPEAIFRAAASGSEHELRALLSHDFCFDDRKKRSLVRGGIEEFLRAVDFIYREMGARLKFSLIAVAGDRLALQRARIYEAPGRPEFIMDSCRLTELDEAGLIRSIVLFDPEDEPAAFEEFMDRYAAQGAEGTPAAAIDIIRALNAHDLPRARAGFCDDMILHDHRRTGLGLIQGADAYIQSVAALLSIASNLTLYVLYVVKRSPRGQLSLHRIAGTNLEGGEVEMLFYNLSTYRDGKVSRAEFFELDQIDAALARFQEFCADSAAADGPQTPPPDRSPGNSTGESAGSSAV